jgi:hypothetical protein
MRRWVAELRKSWEARSLPEAVCAVTPIEASDVVWRSSVSDASGEEAAASFRRSWLSSLPPMVERQPGRRGANAK